MGSGIGVLPANAGLGSKGDAEQIQCALLNHGWLREHIEDGDAFVDGLNSVSILRRHTSLLDILTAPREGPNDCRY